MTTAYERQHTSLAKSYPIRILSSNKKDERSDDARDSERGSVLWSFDSFIFLSWDKKHAFSSQKKTVEARVQTEKSNNKQREMECIGETNIQAKQRENVIIIITKNIHMHTLHILFSNSQKRFSFARHTFKRNSQTGKRKQEKDQRSMYELRTWRESDSKQTWERDTEETRPEQSTLFIDTVKRIDEGLQTKEHMTNLYTNRTRHPLPVKIESHGWSSSSSQRRPKREDEQQETEAGSCTTAG